MKQTLIISFSYGGDDWKYEEELEHLPLTRWEDYPDLVELIVYGVLFEHDWSPPLSDYLDFKYEIITTDADPNDVR